MPSYRCRDVGIDCRFEAAADTEEELMRIIEEHAGKAHDMKTIPPDVMKKIKKAIREYHH